MNIRTEQIKKILILRTDNLGDLVLSLPAILSLKKELPNSEISLLVSKKNEALAKILPYVDKIITVASGNFFTLLPVVARVRKTNFDAVIQLYTGSNIKEAILIFFSRARYRLGYSQGLSGIFFNKKVRLELNRNETFNTMRIINNFIPQAIFRGSGLEPGYVSSKRVIFLFKKYGIKDSEKIIVMHPGSSQKNRNKMWPLQKYSALIEKIVKIFSYKIFIIGTDEEKAYTEQIASSENNVFDLTGLLGLYDLVNLISKSSIFIGNNSGPLQIAVALGIPSVSLMGPSLHDRWAPQGERHSIIQKKIACVPCEGKNTNCSDNVCMKLISVDEVYDAVKLQLNKTFMENNN